MSTINVVGAYGRTYDSIVTAKEDWLAGKDFKIVGGPYLTIHEWEIYKEDSTVVYESNTSDWVLQQGNIEDYWDRQERMARILNGMP